MAAATQRTNVYTLPKKIAALRLSEGAEKTALFTELPKGAEIEVDIDTPGLHDRMVTVRWDNQRYSVFPHDINLQVESKISGQIHTEIGSN